MDRIAADHGCVAVVVIRFVCREIDFSEELGLMMLEFAHHFCGYLQTEGFKILEVDLNSGRGARHGETFLRRQDFRAAFELNLHEIDEVDAVELYVNCNGTATTKMSECNEADCEAVNRLKGYYLKLLGGASWYDNLTPS